jgi:hypothetical protein
VRFVDPKREVSVFLDPGIDPGSINLVKIKFFAYLCNFVEKNCQMLERLFIVFHSQETYHD